jgi:hypothetical protein
MFLTALALGGFAFLLRTYWNDTDRLSALGGFIGGAGSFLAIVWLVVTVREQQRAATDAAYHAALATIASTLETFDRSLASNTDAALRSTADIFDRFTYGMDNDWDEVLHSGSLEDARIAFYRWLPIEGAAVKFVGLVAMCGRTYAAAVPDCGIRNHPEDARFVATNAEALTNVPQLLPYMGNAGRIAILLIECHEVISRMHERAIRAAIGVSPSSPGFSAKGTFEAYARNKAQSFRNPNRFS